jgi:dCTP deaminase
MTIAPDRHLLTLLEDGLLDPWDPALVNPASIDVRLGPTLLVEHPSSPALRTFSIANTTEAAPHFLEPGAFVLAETIETFHVPETVAVQFMLKSSRAREGINSLMAGYADPGFNNSKLTLELHNVRRYHSVPIWHGMKIGQLIVKRLAAPPTRSYAEVGRYNNLPGVTASKGHV